MSEWLTIREVSNKFKIHINTIRKATNAGRLKCSLTGMELKFKKHSTDSNGTASLDRIDNNKGYIKGNVQWVHKKLNFMKGKLTQEEFIQFC